MKQYTTAPILVNSNGDPIPQYLDITDKTDSPQGTFKPLTNETIQKVQLTGRNVEVITVFEGLAITDTNMNLSGKLDVTKYKKISFLVRNTLDSDITLHLYDQTKLPWQVLIEEQTPEGWKQTPGVSINSNSQRTRAVSLSMFFSTNIDVIFEAIRIGAIAKNTPTTGSLTIHLLGVVN